MKMKVENIAPYFDNGKQFYRVELYGLLTQEEMLEVLSKINLDCINVEVKD